MARRTKEDALATRSSLLDAAERVSSPEHAAEEEIVQDYDAGDSLQKRNHERVELAVAESHDHVVVPGHEPHRQPGARQHHAGHLAPPGGEGHDLVEQGLELRDRCTGEP
mgnify:CR=1 FL=1